MRRAARLAAHLVPQPAAWITELPTVAQDGDGAASAASIATLTRQMEDAAARSDFLTAHQLHATLAVLGPRPAPAPPLSAYASEDPDAAADLLLLNGFVLLPRCVAPAELAVMRAAYARVADGCHAAWRASWDAGRE